MSSTTPFALLGEPPKDRLGETDRRDTRERLYELAEWICDPQLLIRRTDSIEFTDLTTISHRMRLEFPDGRWPYPVPHPSGLKSGEKDSIEPLGLVFLGFMRRGMPLQHSRVTMFEGGDQYALTRLKASDTEHLAVLLLDAVWLSCSVNELSGIPRPLEGESRDALKYRDDRYNISPFWQEFLGMRGRNVNPDWDLLKTRFELSESGWANEIWRPPASNEPKWSYERALLAKLCSKLAFSYIAAAWVPANAMGGTDGPFEVELEFQERVLRPREQEERVRSVRRRSKKAFERSLLQLDEREAEDGGDWPRSDVTPESLDTNLWRLDNVPETYLGLLDPALDDPDGSKQGRWNFDRREPIDRVRKERRARKKRDWALSFALVLLVGFLGWLCLGFRPSVGGIGSALVGLGIFAGAVLLFLGLLRHLRVVIAWVVRNRRQLIFPVALGFIALTYTGALWPAPAGSVLGFVILDVPLVPFLLFAIYLLARVTRFLRWARRETMILPTWAAGPTSIVYEVSCPPEFTVWQGILARPSRRGRCWRTRPASELGRRAHLWWSEPNDRGWIEESPEDRPQLLVLELRARLSSSITLIGAFLALATGILLAGTASVLLYDLFSTTVNLDSLEKAVQPGSEGENAGLSLSADFIATVLLILPTVGAAILIRPGEDPIARKLLTWDRFVIALSTVVPAVLAVALLVVFGWWWSPDMADDEFIWTIWFWLGCFSFLSSGILFLAWTQTRGSDTPAPSARQGGFPPYPNPRRRPLDVAAPLGRLATMKGRLMAERNLLRLAPVRSRGTPRPNYSLVLPAEGSRIYSPPKPTILCLVENPGEETGRRAAFAEFVEKGLNGLSNPGYSRGIRNTNTIGWQPGVFSVVPNPLTDSPYLSKNKGPDDNEPWLTEMLLHLYRLQKANARPSRSKPIGNGGGLVPLSVPRLPERSGSSIEEVLCEKFARSNLFDTEDSGKGGSTDWRKKKLEALVGRRALLDVDGVILIPKEVSRKLEASGFNWDRLTFDLHTQHRLSVRLGRFAAAEARRAGSGPGAHVWPSSFEPPLAGESWGWGGLGSPPSFLSLRSFFFPWKDRDNDDLGCFTANPWRGIEAVRYLITARLQEFFFDQASRAIPVSKMELRGGKDRKFDLRHWFARRKLKARSLFDHTALDRVNSMALSQFLLSVPRVFSGVEAQDRNKRIQNILWFGQPEVTGEGGRTCAVELEFGGAEDKQSEDCEKLELGCVRTVTDVVGNRVWVWNKEVGTDHRNFEFREVKRSDCEFFAIDSKGRSVTAEAANPSWELGMVPQQVGGQLRPTFNVPQDFHGTQASRKRRIIGRFVTWKDVLCARGALTSKELQVISGLEPAHCEQLEKLVPVVTRSAEGSSAVGDEISELQNSASHSGLVVFGQEPWPWRGGIQIPTPPDPTAEPLVILVGGIVASGKSELARRLRTRLERDDVPRAEQWEAIRNDPNHNLFFQIHDFDQDESMDEQEGLNFARDHGDALSQRLTELVQQTYLLESLSEFDRASGNGRGHHGGLIVEYWPSFSVKAMAGVQVNRSLSEKAYDQLEERLKAWEGSSESWRQVVAAKKGQIWTIRIDSSISTCVLRTVKRAQSRHGEKVGSRYLGRLEDVVKDILPETGSSKGVSVPPNARCVVVEDDGNGFFAAEVTRVVKLINRVSDRVKKQGRP